MSSKVLHVIDNMRLGGAQRIVSRLVENNVSHTLHVLRQSDEQMTDTEDYTITKSNWRFNTRSFLDVWMRVNREDPDIVHCHLKKSYYVGLMVKLTSINNFKLVFHEHGEIWKEGNNEYDVMLKYARPLIDKHVAVSEHTATLLNERGKVPEEKIETIYNFVDEKKFNSEVLENFQKDLQDEVDPDCFTIGFAGRIVERKGWRTIVSAAEKLEDDFQIVMTGSGKGENELEEKAQETENLEYLGYIDDVRSLFAAIDCFVLPSHWDPSPMIFYEIQSCGIPLICTDAHAIDELVEDRTNGLMFEPKNADELVNKIKQAESNRDLREKIVQNGLLKAEKYSYDRFEENLQRMYDDL
jgi:glycosyltransferase involved in cell wall biosynthesis